LPVVSCRWPVAGGQLPVLVIGSARALLQGGPRGDGACGAADFCSHRGFTAWLDSNPGGADGPRTILTGMIIPVAALGSMAPGSAPSMRAMQQRRSFLPNLPRF